jgi:hypothetical protein
MVASYGTFTVNQSNEKGVHHMEEKKKVYLEPKLTVHGDVEEITMVGGPVFPADVPMGQQPSAYPS